MRCCRYRRCHRCRRCRTSYFHISIIYSSSWSSYLLVFRTKYYAIISSRTMTALVHHCCFLTFVFECVGMFQFTIEYFIIFEKKQNLIIRACFCVSCVMCHVCVWVNKFVKPQELIACTCFDCDLSKIHKRIRFSFIVYCCQWLVTNIMSIHWSPFDTQYTNQNVLIYSIEGKTLI